MSVFTPTLLYMRPYIQMKKILLTAATYPEIKFLESKGLKRSEDVEGLYSFPFRETSFDVLVTGAGMVATVFHLTRLLTINKYDLVLNTGIAGALDRSLAIADVVNITEDRFADLGAEDDLRFLSLFELGLADANAFPFENGTICNHSPILFRQIQTLRKVAGITVNKVHGSEQSIHNLLLLLQHDNLPTGENSKGNELKNLPVATESMEGAAFMYVCTMFNMPYFQIRAISNYVEKRNRSAWQIENALANLQSVILTLMDEINAGL